MYFPYQKFPSHQIERLNQIVFASVLFHSRHGITYMVGSSRRTYTLLEHELSSEKGLAILLSKAIDTRTNTPTHIVIHTAGLKSPLLSCWLKLFKRLPKYYRLLLTSLVDPKGEK